MSNTTDKPVRTGPIEVTKADLETAFTEWDRRYWEDPHQFMSNVEHLLGTTAETYGETYGEACAAYLLGLLEGAI
jgi:hypothetical protein